jgi:hypothetical protein
MNMSIGLRIKIGVLIVVDGDKGDWIRKGNVRHLVKKGSGLGEGFYMFFRHSKVHLTRQI